MSSFQGSDHGKPKAKQNNYKAKWEHGCIIEKWALRESPHDDLSKKFGY